MKKLFFTLSLFFALTVAQAQTAPDYSKYPLDTEENIKKADEAVKQTNTFLLGTPVTKDPQKRLEAMQYLFQWMEATPDYTFAVDQTIAIMGQDQQLLGVYISALAKYHLDTKAKEGGQEATLATLKTVAEYVSNSANNVKPTGDLKKMVEANKNGKLKEFVEKYGNK